MGFALAVARARPSEDGRYVTGANLCRYVAAGFSLAQGHLEVACTCTIPA